MTELPVVLMPEDVATMLKISKRAVLDLARAYRAGNPRGLPGVKVLREWRFTAEDVAAYLAANRTPPPAISALPVTVDPILGDSPAGMRWDGRPHRSRTRRVGSPSPETLRQVEAILAARDERRRRG